MTKYFLAALFATLFASTSFAQHSDIEFGFEDPAVPVFEIELDELTDEGIQVAEGEFVRAGAFATTDNPGFITPFEVEEDENGVEVVVEELVVNEGDQVFVRVLDASAAGSPTTRGVGFVNFYNPVTDALENLDASSGTLTITGSDNATSVFAGDQLVSGNEDVFLAVGSDGTFMSTPPPTLEEDPELLTVGRIHNHLAFDLSGDLATTDGAVGLLLQFTTVPADGSAPVESDPYFLIFNNGLEELPSPTGFVDALAAFGLDEEEEGILGDINGDGMIDFDDIPAFIALLQDGGFNEAADFDGDGMITFADIPGFIAALQNA